MSDNTKRNFGAIEDIDFNIDMEVYEEPKYIQILRNVKSAVGFDISIKSTGIAIWHEGQLSFAVIDVSGQDSEEGQREELLVAISQILGEKEFDIIGIEGVFGGVNFTVVHNLMALNTVPDDLVSRKIIKSTSIIRKDNQEWKSILRNYKKVLHAPTPKVEIREILESLDFPVDSLSRFNTKDKSDRDQDLLDALGLLLAIITEKCNLVQLEEKSKVSYKDVKIWYCESIDEYLACYNDNDNYEIIDINKNFKTQLLSHIKRTNAQTTLLLEVSTDLLGKFALEYGIPFEMDTVCIVVMPKGKKKPKKKNGGKTIIIQ